MEIAHKKIAACRSKPSKKKGWEGRLKIMAGINNHLAGKRKYELWMWKKLQKLSNHLSKSLSTFNSTSPSFNTCIRTLWTISVRPEPLYARGNHQISFSWWEIYPSLSPSERNVFLDLQQTNYDGITSTSSICFRASWKSTLFLFFLSKQKG